MPVATLKALQPLNFLLLFAELIGRELQFPRQLGVLLQEFLYVFDLRQHVAQILTRSTINASARVLKFEHPMRLPEDVIAIEQPVQLLNAQAHHILTQQTRPVVLLRALDLLRP